MLLELILISFLPLPQTELYSDRTARGGGTTVTLTESNDGLNIRGTLKGVIGRQGTRVGFVGLRRELRLGDETKLFIRVEGIENLKARAVFRTTQSELAPYSGDLTFQTLLEKTDQKNLYRIDLTRPVATIRGREIEEEVHFDTKDVIDFAFELKLSEQDFDQEAGLPFDIKVFFE